MRPQYCSSYTPACVVRLADICDRTRLLLLGAALVMAPLALGGRATWFLPIAVLVNAGGFALLFVEKACSGERLRLHWCWLVAATLLVIPALQLIPSEALASALSPGALASWERARSAGFTDLTARLSLAPVRTAVGLWMLAQVLLFAFLVYNSFASRARLLLLSACLVGAALVNAVSGLLPVVLDAPPLFADLAIVSKPLSGTFENRNHFAFLLALGMVQLAALAWAVYQTGVGDGESTRPRSLESRLQKKRNPLLLLFALAGVIMALSLLLSLSRAGCFAALAGLAAFLCFGLRGTDPARRRKWIIWSGLLGAIVVAGSMEALLGLWGRYDALMKLGNLGLLGRWNVWGETADLIARFPWTGVGLGAFEPVSPMVESGFVPGRISFHAHNDYLELLSEVGLPVGIAILGLLTVACLTLWRRVLRCDERLARVLGIASLSALLAAAVHEMVEYNVRSPANGFVVATFAVLALLAAELGSASRRKRRYGSPRTSRRPESLSLSVRAVMLTSAILVGAVALGVLPARIAEGCRVTRLRAAAESREAGGNTGVARLTQAKFFLAETEKILGVLPKNERALYYRAIYQQILASGLSKAAAGEEAAPEDAERVVTAVIESRESARRLCRYSPTDGAYQALFAKQLNLSAWYDEEVAIPEIIRAFEVAHTSFPNVPQVAWRCIQAFGEILRVDRDELSAAELERLEKKLARMGRSLLEIEPARAPDILPVLDGVFEDVPRLVEATPRRLLCYEPLYELLFRQKQYERCSEVLDTMKKINAERVTRENSAEVSLYELTRTHPASRQEMAAEIVRKELELASVSKDWQAYDALRSTEHEARRDVCLAELDDARAAADAGDIRTALREGRALLARFPQIAECRASVGGWLVTIGEYDAALDCLQPLMWLDSVSPEVLRLGRSVCGKLAADKRSHRYANLLSDVLTVRIAALGKEHPAQGLAPVVRRLEAWAAPAAHNLQNRSRFSHLALYYAGRGRELLGYPENARSIYQRALELCPLHKKTIQRLLALPAPEEATEAADALVPLRDLSQHPERMQRDLIDVHAGLTLKDLRFSPPTLHTGEAVTVTALLEVTDDLLALPQVRIRLEGADGVVLSHRIDLAATKSGSTDASPPRVGSLLPVVDSFNPSVAALRAGAVLVPGTVVARIPGKGRDQGFAIYVPAFSVEPTAEGQ